MSEIARKLNVDPETARQWAVAGRLPVFRYNGKGRWRAFEEDIDKFLEQHRSSTPTGQVESASQ